MPAKHHTQPEKVQDGVDLEDQQVPAPKTKKKRTSNDDLTDNTVFEERTRTMHVPSTKQCQTTIGERTSKPQPNAEDDDDRLSLESEEEDEPAQTVNLHSSIRRGLPITPTGPQQPAEDSRLLPLRRHGDAIPLTPQTQESTAHLDDMASSATRSSSPDLQTRTPSRRSHSLLSTTLMIAPFRSNQPSNGRPKVCDYVDQVKVLLLDSIRIFECFIYTINPFPSMQEQEQWVRKIWTMVTCKDGQHYELSDWMITIVNKSSEVKRTRRHRRFGTPVDAESIWLCPRWQTKNTERKNIQRYQNLTDNSAFHYKTYDTATEVLFKNTRALGVEHQKYFDPISLVTIAFIFTVISANLDEWASGKFVQAPFRESDHKETYQNHLKDLMEWERSAPEVVQNIRKKWHDRARRIAGAVQENAANGRVSVSAIFRRSWSCKGEQVLLIARMRTRTRMSPH
ncbi:hypothetical protein A0H81_07112 [Grifola frondosa]|uniref:DUF6532 domain-containing protein n=1 Tax=Grifola frondosa TaxID=5627 RepID=A0A1C7MAI8_GRIFR|nr:hypothetical protein A0H81_07112 [Grifola frondosa]